MRRGGGGCSEVTYQSKNSETQTTKRVKETRKHTQSPSGSAPGTNTLISLDLAVVIDVPRDSLLKYNWQPVVLSTEIVGADPYNSHIVGKRLRSYTRH